MVNELHRLHENFVLVPADKASNNIVFVCKSYYYNCLINELGFTSTSRNPTYTQSNLTKDEILPNHRSVLNTFNIPNNQDQFELPYLYCIPKLHKNPYKQRYIAGSSKCSTKPLSVLLAKVLTVLKSHFRDTVLLHIPGVVSIRNGFSKILENFWKIDSHKNILRLAASKRMIYPHFMQQFLTIN